MDMDLINDFFQKTLPLSFGFEDDFVIESLRESVDELNSMQLDTSVQYKINKTIQTDKLDSQENFVNLSNQDQKPAESSLIPILKVSHSARSEASNDTSDDEPIVTADADLTVIVEEADESIHSSRSICSSRDDISSSIDFYEVGRYSINGVKLGNYTHTHIYGRYFTYFWSLKLNNSG